MVFKNINTTDKDLAKLLKKELNRQQSQLQMIPSENYTSQAVLEAVGSVVINKYSEGQPNKRYYQGNQYIDEIELLTQQRALKLFDLDPSAWSVNVQPFNGSTANLAVYLSLLTPGDTIMGMYLPSGGHLSHGWKMPDGRPVSMTSKIFNSVFYNVDPQSQVFNYDKIRTIALKEKPKMIISGGTAYPREIDHQKMAQISQEVNAFYLADIAHEAGLVATKENKSPFEYADVVTMTTRKTLRGPIGAMIFSKIEHSEKINKTVFPGLQGGPPNHQIAGISAALGEALKPDFKKYTKQVIKNAQVLSNELKKHDFNLVSGGTEKHLILIDLRNKDIDGWYAAWALEYAGIITNRNTVPFDEGSPYFPNGLRLGTPAITTRGMRENEMIVIANYINTVINEAKLIIATLKQTKLTSKQKRAEFKNKASANKTFLHISNEIKGLCEEFPIYQN